MAFTDMNDVEQELEEEKPPEKNGNRTFLIIAGTLAGIMVLALLCIGGLALFRYLPNQRASQDAAATTEAHSTALALSASQTAAVPTATATLPPTYTPTSSPLPTKTPLPSQTPLPTRTALPTRTSVIGVVASNTPTIDPAIATRNALLTQIAATHVITTSTQKATATARLPTSTALPTTGIADELGTPGLITATFVLLAIIVLARRLRTSS
jgi:hypothetical protein